ncbi:BfmA/BtgA family mobilization protein [Leeuwenhoekiella polynyae]|nr:BfmA/BtgA family mobilization protein [Leeuwenhoekiella polynyae]
MAKKSILISAYHHKELTKLSEVYNLKYYELVEEMIGYFKKTGINPKESKNENPSRALKELDKRMVSFLKVQERDILKPLRQEVYEYSKDQKQEIKELHTKLIKALNTINQNEKLRADNLLEEIQKQRKITFAIAQLIDAKNKSGILSKINTLFD